jgi:hypothetical protein
MRQKDFLFALAEVLRNLKGFLIPGHVVNVETQDLNVDVRSLVTNAVNLILTVVAGLLVILLWVKSLPLLLRAPVY